MQTPIEYKGDELGAAAAKSDTTENDDVEERDDEDLPDGTPPTMKQKRAHHRLSLKVTKDFNEELAKRGVVYISRIPPRMTPTKLKSLLADFDVTRLYLVEEDKAKRKRRRKETGNGSKRYTEGWIEFASRQTAKAVAGTLHNTKMSNYKRSHFYDDLWSLKYLSKFTWAHLTEKVAYERRVREQRLKLETMQARRETAAYKNLVEQGKVLDHIEQRKRNKQQRHPEQQV